MSSLEERYNRSMERVERIFSVPDFLRQLFLSGFSEAEKRLGDAPHTVKKVFENRKKLLNNINQSTMTEAKEEYFSILYEDTVIFTVSVAEQILKDCFNELVRNNLEKLDLDEEFSVNFKTLKNSDFKTDKEFWANYMIQEIHGSRSPHEKANFQNILAIEDLFSKYFKIKIEGPTYREVANRAHYYFQVRHILAHNSGIIDERFVKNVSKIGKKVSESKIGTKISITRHQYDTCKYCFGSLLHHLDREIANTGLALEG